MRGLIERNNMNKDNSLFRFSRKKLHEVNNGNVDKRFDLLSDAAKSEVLEISKSIDGLLREREKVVRLLVPLTEEKEGLDAKINFLRQEMCGIQGHRFNADDVINIPEMGEFYKCTLCGELVNTGLVMPNDAFVPNGKIRVRIQYKKK